MQTSSKNEDKTGSGFNDVRGRSIKTTSSNNNTGELVTLGIDGAVFFAHDAKMMVMITMMPVVVVVMVVVESSS